MYLGKILLDGEKIFAGFGTYLLPREAKGILRLCFGANINFRIGNYAKSKRIPIELATKKVKEFDRNLFFFTKTYLKKTPYEPNDFHFNIDVEKYKAEEIIYKILELVHNWNYNQGEDTKKILQDYVIENRILAIFLGEKEDIDVNFRNGKLTLLVKKQKIRMKNYFEYLRSRVPQLPEIKDVEISFSKEIKLGSSLAMNLEKEPNVLLVDDEVEFVDTLSQRLESRQIHTKVAYSGEEALDSITFQTPDVIILDLKMPGIDGIEVLRKVKSMEPKTEVIILTGHGTEHERQLAIELGAFAYLEKPVDINLLHTKLNEAYEKIRKSKIL